MQKKVKKRLIIGIVILVILLLPVAWYLGSPLFLDKTVNEEVPLDVNGTILEAKIIYSGSFSGADSFHRVKGTASVLSGENKKYLRFEDFESTNGPDLKVYLSKDTEAKDYIKLGNLKGNIGDQNYEIPEGTDLDEYKYVLVWCERFSVLFGTAQLEKKVVL